jgi:MFS family permease
MFILTGFGLVSPILAIFISTDITGGSIMSAGIASAIFLCTKAFVQIPFSRYVDNHEKKVLWLHIGTILIVSVPIQYYFAKSINAIYVSQFIYGLGAGLASPAWLSLWSKHLDANHEAFEWSVYFGTISIGTALSAFIGGTLATYLGFRNTLIIMGTLSLIGIMVLIRLQNTLSNELIQSNNLINNSNSMSNSNLEKKLPNKDDDKEKKQKIRSRRHKYTYHKNKHQ